MSSAKPKHNAFKHGLYSAKQLVLPWEKEQEFVELHRALIDEFAPEGLSEEIVVADMARLHWIKRRLIVGAHLTSLSHPEYPVLTEAAQNDSEGVEKHYQNIAAKRDRAIDVLHETAAVLYKAGFGLANLTSELTAKVIAASPDEETTQIEKKIENLTQLAKEFGVVIPAMEISVKNLELHERAFPKSAYAPDLIEQSLKLHAEIDRQIDKQVRRLVNYKEYKLHYTPRTVTEIMAPKHA